MSDWIEQEQERANTQAKTGEVPNPKAALAPKRRRVKSLEPRKTKGFQLDETRIEKWDRLCAEMKNHKSNKRTSTQLIDEALDHIFKKYENA